MDKETRALNRLNNETDALLNEENRRYLTDIVCWLRRKNVEDYQVEVIRNDVTDLLLRAQERGERAADVLGEDLPAFCQDLLEGSRRKSRRKVALEYLQTTLYALTIFSGITFLYSTVEKAVWAARGGHAFDWRWDITAGTLVSWLVLTGVVYLLLAWILASPLVGRKEKHPRLKSGLLGAGLMALCLALAWISAAVLPAVPLSLPVLPTAAGYAVLAVIWKLWERRQ